MNKNKLRAGDKVKGIYFDPFKIFEVTWTGSESFKVNIKDELGYGKSSHHLSYLDKNIKKIKSRKH